MKTTHIPPDTTIYPTDTLGHPTDTPQTSPGNTTCQQTTRDANRHRQTYSSSTCQCLAVSGGVCWRLLACSVPWRGLGGVWWMSVGCLEVSAWHSWKSEALGCVWGYLGSHSLHYGAKTLFWYIPKMQDFCSHDPTETFRYQNGRILALQKSLGLICHFCDFYVCQRYITCYSCF